jgi:hypothetical protein
MATSNETAAPATITVDQMIASARLVRTEAEVSLASLRESKARIAERIAEKLIEFNEADRIVKALTPREPKVRTPKSKKETNG